MHNLIRKAAPIIYFFVSSVTLFAQESNIDKTIFLSTDAEFMGALLDKTGSTIVNNEGQVIHAILKKEYLRDGVTYKEGTSIKFYDDGSILSGQLKYESTINNWPIAAKSVSYHSNGQLSSASTYRSFTDRNLTIPANTDVDFNRDGTVNTIKNPSPHVVLERTVQGSSSFFIKESKYHLSSARFYYPQYIARLATYTNGVGFENKSIVAPELSIYRSSEGNKMPYDTWSLGGGSFVCNSIDFGANALLYIDKKRLVKVMLATNRVIEGRQYKTGDVIFLTESGRVANIAPQLQN